MKVASNLTLTNSLGYRFHSKKVILPSSLGDRIEYMKEYAHLYDFYDSFDKVLRRYTNEKPISEQVLVINKSTVRKSDDQIWDDLKIKNALPNVIVDRLIDCYHIAKDNFPLIIGYFEDEPVVVEPGIKNGKEVLEVRLLERGYHHPNTFIVCEYPNFPNVF